MMKNEKELAARGCLCVEPSSPECSVPYIVTDPKGELRHYDCLLYTSPSPRD